MSLSKNILFKNQILFHFDPEYFLIAFPNSTTLNFSQETSVFSHRKEKTMYKKPSLDPHKNRDDWKLIDWSFVLQ